MCFVHFLKDGRSITIIALILFFSFLTVSSFMGRGDMAWGLLKVDGTPSLGDLRSITSALDGAKQGIDVYRDGSFNPWNIPFNYPRVWLLLGKVGISQQHTVVFAGVSVLLFFFCVFSQFTTLTLLEGLYLTLVVFSPSVMQCVQRGNNDLIIFILIGITLYLLTRQRICRAASMLLIASGLKLYPIVCIFLLFGNSKKQATYLALGVLCAFILYLSYTLSDLKLIFHNTPKPASFSYGSAVAPYLLVNTLHDWGYIGVGPSEPTLTVVADMVLVFLLSAVFISVRMLQQPGFGAAVSNDAAACGLRAGALIFIGTFFLGYNWDYRLIFLVFTIPQLFILLRDKPIHSNCAAVALFLICLSLNWAWVDNGIYPNLLGEVINWLIVLLLFYLCIVSLQRRDVDPVAIATA